MRLRHFTSLLLGGFFIHSACYAQPGARQRLQAILLEKQAQKNYAADTGYINVLNQLAFAYYTVSADSVFLYARQALDYAKKTGYGMGELVALRQMGNGYRLKGDYVNMLSSYQQALTVAEKTHDTTMIAKTLVSIAQPYLEMRKTDEALVLLERAAKLSAQTGDSGTLNKSLDGTGEIWYRRKQYDKALQYFQQSMRVAAAMKNEYLYIIGTDQIAKVLYAKEQYHQALSYYLHSLDYSTRTENRLLGSMSATMVALSYKGLKKYPEALTYAQLSYQTASTLGSTLEMKNAGCILVDIYKAMGDYRNALKYTERVADISDTLSNEQMRSKMARLEAKYEYERKEMLLKEEQAKKDIRHEAVVRAQRLEIGLAIIVIIFLSVLVYQIWCSRKAKQKANLALVAMNTKISRQKREIEHQSLQLLISNQQKDKLFGIIAHDLKTPLQSLNMTLDLLKTKALSEYQVTRMMDELKRDADFSSGLVKNLLYWANSQLNGIAAVPVTLHLRQLTDDVLGLFPAQAAEKKIALRNELDPAVAGYADKDMMHLVMRNLISNALKFCRPGDAITISGQPNGEAVEICVADTGMGIEKNVLDKIKEKRIVTSFGSANEKGTGIGLLLCREFIELNHGLFRIESEWGQGNRCYITLPIFPRTI